MTEPYGRRVVARSSGEEPDGASYAADWARLHGGVDPTGSLLVGRWVRLLAAVARPLARRNVAPTAVTAAAVAVAAGAAVVAGQAPWRAAVTALLVVLSG